MRLMYSSRLRSNYLVIDGCPDPEHVVRVAVMHRAHKWVRGHRVVALALATSTGGHTPEQFIREDRLADTLAA